MHVNKIIIGIIVLAAALYAGAAAHLSDEAAAFFAKGEYLKGQNVLTKAMNAQDPAERASAMLAYANFYENIVGNIDYASNFYADVLRISLPDSDPIKEAARKEISKIKVLKGEYQKEDTLLKKLLPAESASDDIRKGQISQLLAIIQQKPQYYRLADVYYQLGRNYFANNDYYDAYVSLKKSLELKPGVNFYLPVNVWIEASYGKWLRANIHKTSWGILGGLLVLTVIAFYASRPWRWLKFRHLAIGLSMVVLWLIVFSVSYVWFTRSPGASDRTMFEANVVPPYFFSFGPDSPFWPVTKILFIYGLIGILGLFVFSIGTSRLKWRWVAALSNLLFAILLFSSLATVFYMQNCDQKSIFNSDSKDGGRYYLHGSNYFVTFGMEPYILTNPRDYPDLAVSNVADPYMRDWLLKYCPFSPPQSKPAQQK
jgi:hypothetical protein